MTETSVFWAGLVFAGLLVGASAAGCKEPPSLPSTPPSSTLPQSRIAFTDVTARAGLGGFRHETGAFGKKWNPEWMGAGGGFIDYNGDGWLDILLVGGGAWKQSKVSGVQALWLYENNGDGTFTEATRAAGLKEVSAYGFGITAADYDNDGDEDFFLTTLHENLLFQNNAGRFVEVGQAAGVAGDAKWSSAGVFFDANQDGWLDLYVGNYVDWSPAEDVWCSLTGETKAYCTPHVFDGVPGRFYQSNGDGTFTDRTEAAGFLPAPGKTLGVSVLDYNRDGGADLIVANDTEQNLLYKNNNDGTFTEIGVRSSIAYDENGKARAGMGVDAGIVDSTGRYSVFVGNFSKEMIGVYRHLKKDLFVDRAALSQIGLPSRPILTFGLFLFDVELDGDRDLFAANGHMQSDISKVHDGVQYRQPVHLYVNHYDGTFEEVGGQLGGVLAERLVARGAAYGDIDQDGDLDVLLTENGGSAHLWRNDSQKGHYLRVKLKGRKSSRSGIGAELRLVSGKQELIRRVRTGSSYLSQSEKTVTFGLGDAVVADSLVVYWPSGQTDTLASIPADQQILIREGASSFETLVSSAQLKKASEGL